MEGLSEGRIVHFVLEEGLNRAAMIANAWNGSLEDGMVNLLVFLDGENDIERLGRLMTNTYLVPYGTVYWATSVKYSEKGEVGTWHWPERK